MKAEQSAIARAASIARRTTMATKPISASEKDRTLALKCLRT
jgi:hypothetical protein